MLNQMLGDCNSEQTLWKVDHPDIFTQYDGSDYCLFKKDKKLGVKLCRKKKSEEDVNVEAICREKPIEKDMRDSFF